MRRSKRLIYNCIAVTTNYPRGCTPTEGTTSSGRTPSVSRRGMPEVIPRRSSMCLGSFSSGLARTRRTFSRGCGIVTAQLHPDIKWQHLARPCNEDLRLAAYHSLKSWCGIEPQQLRQANRMCRRAHTLVMDVYQHNKDASVARLPSNGIDPPFRAPQRV